MQWTGARYADTPTVEADVSIAAPPSRVWSLISDIGLMPTIGGGELQAVSWLGDVAEPRPGARFRGVNRHPAMGEWQTVSEVISYLPPRDFAWAVRADAQDGRPSSIWRFTVAPEGSGTRLTQWMQLGPGRSGLSLAIDAMPDKEQKIVFVRLRECEQRMRQTLDAIQRLAEQRRPGPVA